MLMQRLLLGLLALLTAGIVNAQSFTYQGFLKDGGAPANGSYDFRFMLWTQSTGGVQVGSELYVDAVSVQNGLFTVQLDFGSVWDDANRYLEIKVRRVGRFGYWLLQPRVKINPTPYAAFALRPWSTSRSRLTIRCALKRIISTISAPRDQSPIISIGEQSYWMHGARRGRNCPTTSA